MAAKAEETVSPTINDQSCSQSQSSSMWLEEQFEKVFARYPDQHPQYNYYMEYCRLHIANTRLLKEVLRMLTQIGSLKEEKAQLEKMLHQVDKKQGKTQSKDSGEESNEKKRRMRRTAGQIARHYVCQYPQCRKSYGSEGSLNQHVKLKHPTQS